MKKTYLIISALLLTSIVFGQTFLDKFSRVAAVTNVTSPTAFVFAPDGRIFITEQTGKLRVFKNGSLLATPFVQLMVDSNGERGLLGVALDPNFSINGFIYLYYTVPGTTAHNRISKFKASGDVSDGTEVTVLDLDNLSSATNHNGGSIAFGPDGKLYVAVGENANGANSQNLDTYLGKILRINSDGSVPSGNPFNGSNQKSRVWSYGFRNPFTFTFQPGTNKLFVNDVGQSAKEEINDATTGGLNYGWPTAEGTSTTVGFTNPLFTYDHGSGDGKGCAITGGTFFNPSATTYPPTYTGKYFYQDLCNGWINYIDILGTAQRFAFATSVGGNGLAIATGPDGNLYYLSINDKTLYKILFDNSSAPAITKQPVNVDVTLGAAATFSIEATSVNAISYQWKKNGIDINGANAASLVIPSAQASDIGVYKVSVGNSLGSVTSNEVSLNINSVVGFEADKKQLVVYPSPAKHWVYVHCDKELIESVELRDNLGRVKITPLPERISQDLVAIDVRSLSAGIYFLMVRFPGGNSTRKLMIGSDE